MKRRSPRFPLVGPHGHFDFESWHALIVELVADENLYENLRSVFCFVHERPIGVADLSQGDRSKLFQAGSKL